MRTPDTKTPLGDEDRSRFLDATISDKQWQKIRVSLVAIGINANTVIVETGLGERPLREGLPLIAFGCDIAAGLRKDAPTPSQTAKEVGRTIDLCRDLLARLDDPRNYNRLDPDRETLQFPHLSSRVHRTRIELQKLVADLERYRDELTAQDGRRGARDLHIRFWQALRRVWHMHIIRDDVKWTTSNNLASFLIACSEPFFPEETTDTAISAFIER